LRISVDFLSLIERGINATPSFEKIEQIAERLRVPVRTLFDFPEEETKR
jgi:transcriptional regulator with XRE-family HTH domain